jgi:hypothetical protein
LNGASLANCRTVLMSTQFGHCLRADRLQCFLDLLRLLADVRLAVMRWTHQATFDGVSSPILRGIPWNDVPLASTGEI